MGEEEFFQFIKENLDNAYGFAFSYVNNSEDAEDVVSESIIKALDSIDKLRNPEYVKTWFFRIIINTANTMFYKKNKFTLVESDDSQRLDYLLPEHFDDYSDINFYDMLDILTPEKRLVIILRFFEDYKIKDISEVLDVNENTVKKRLYSALNDLKVKIEEDNSERLQEKL